MLDGRKIERRACEHAGAEQREKFQYILHGRIQTQITKKKQSLWPVGKGQTMEARGGIEPPIKVLQTFALPLGDRASATTAF